MKKLILIQLLSFLGVCLLSAQPTNDICSDAIEITDLQSNCTLYDFSNATFDLRNGICAPAFARNVWFSFEAVGTDIDIQVSTNNGPNAFITLYEFLPPACSPSSTFEIGCDTNELNMENVLSIGGSYYINVAYPQNYQDNYLLCVNNPEINLDPTNDYKCFARPVQLNNKCIDGTTENATFDLNNPICPFADVHSVWYRGVISSGKNRLDVKLTNKEFAADVSLFIAQYPNNDCTEPIDILGGACFDSTGQATFTGLLPGRTYFFMVSHKDGEGQDFEICFTEKGPVNGCAVNDFCNTAEILSVGTDSGNICVPGCNQGATFGPTNLPSCYYMNTPTVWYRLTTDEYAGYLRIDMTSDSLRFPQVAVYTGNCATLDTVGCKTGNGGRTNFFLDVIPETEYFIAVTDVARFQGVFNLCLEVLPDPQACLVQDTLYALSTSFGSPLEGPYQTGETVTFIYQIDQWNKDNCNKLSGIVPSFGPGWDPSSFDSNRKPTIIEAPRSNTQGQWNWYPAGEVRYNYDNIGRGYFRGSALPAGYYFVSPPIQTNNPNTSRGDGIGCVTDSSNNWTLIFEVTTFDSEDCPIGINVPADVRVETFSDSETGTGQYRGCLLNESARLSPTVSCCEAPTLTINRLNRNLCSGSSATIDFSNRTDLEEVIWKVESQSGIVPADEGSGLLFSQQIFLIPGVTNGSVTFTFFPKDTTGCIGEGVSVTWDIFPTLYVEAGPDKTACTGSTITLGGNPTVFGGFGTGYIYNWSAGIPMEANPEITVQQGRKTYFLSVTDPVGCNDRDTVSVTGIRKPSLMIFPVGEVCAGQEKTLTIELDGTPPFNWSIQAGNFLNESFTNYNQRTYSTNISPASDFIITAQVNSDANCSSGQIFRDTVDVDPPRSGDTNVILCNGDTYTIDGQTFNRTGNYEILLEGASQRGCDSLVMLDLDVLSPLVIQNETISYDNDAGTWSIKVVIAGGLPPYEYVWSTGARTDSISGLEAGTHTLTVTDRNDCENTFEFMFTTSVENPLLSEVEVYPNPIQASDILNLIMSPSLSGDFGSAKWIGIDGKEVAARFDHSNEQLKVKTPVIPGLYYLQLIDKKGKNMGALQIIVTE